VRFKVLIVNGLVDDHVTVGRKIPPQALIALARKMEIRANQSDRHTKNENC
jgi:hypothetical protein